MIVLVLKKSKIERIVSGAKNIRACVLFCDVNLSGKCSRRRKTGQTTAQNWTNAVQFLKVVLFILFLKIFNKQFFDVVFVLAWCSVVPASI